MNKYLAILAALLLVSCTPNVKVTPNKLPDAYLNQPYTVDVVVTGGTVINRSFSSKTSNNDFKIIPGIRDSGQDNYNNLKINGIATTLEPINIYMYGETYGTNFPGASFEQEYTIEVKVAE